MLTFWPGDILCWSNETSSWRIVLLQQIHLRTMRVTVRKEISIADLKLSFHCHCASIIILSSVKNIHWKFVYKHTCCIFPVLRSIIRVFCYNTKPLGNKLIVWSRCAPSQNNKTPVAWIYNARYFASKLSKWPFEHKLYLNVCFLGDHRKNNNEWQFFGWLPNFDFLPGIIRKTRCRRHV